MITLAHLLMNRPNKSDWTQTRAVICWECFFYWERQLYYICTLLVKGLESLRLCKDFERCLLCLPSIYLIKNTVKTIIVWNNFTILNNYFLFEYIVKCNLFQWSKLYFQHHYSSLQCHMIFRNYSHMLIYWSTNISDYYQCWLFLWEPWQSLMNRN